jgi:uncharacterized membrane protein YozB (DUF420 family)
MTFVLRIFSLIAAFLAIVSFVLPIMMLGHGSSPVRDTLASIFFLLVSVLAARCVRWLWKKPHFWHDRRSLSEVATFTTFLIGWPLGIFFEPRVDGLAKDAVHVAIILVMIAVYFLVRRHGENAAASTV